MRDEILAGPSVDSVLTDTGPQSRIIEADTFAQSAPTPPEGIEGELVHVGAGGIADCDGVDARGKITLSELPYAPSRLALMARSPPSWSREKQDFDK
jgi:hypothetical protein